MSTTSLSLLPADVLIQIASYLPCQDAQALAGTSSLLSPFAEMSVWRALDLSSEYHDPGAWPTDIASNRSADFHLHPSPRSDFSFSDLTTDRAHIHDQMHAIRIDQVVRELAKDDGRRLRSVRELRFSVDQPPISALLSLLHSPSSTLQRLDLVVSPHQQRINPSDPEWLSTAFVLQSGQTFAHLRHLQLPLNQEWESRIRSILPATPYLHSLHLVPTVPFSGGWGETSHYPFPRNLHSWPVLPNLRVLKIDQMATCLLPMVLALIKGVESMKRINFKDPEQTWVPDEGDELLRCLSRMGDLECLILPTWCMSVLKKVAALGQEGVMPSNEEEKVLKLQNQNDEA